MKFLIGRVDVDHEVIWTLVEMCIQIVWDIILFSVGNKKLFISLSELKIISKKRTIFVCCTCEIQITTLFFLL